MSQQNAGQPAQASPLGGMSPEQLVIYQRDLELKLKIMEAKTDFGKFCELMVPDPDFEDDPLKTSYQFRPHHKLIMDRVLSLISPDSKQSRLGVSVPPQSGKSFMLSLLFPIWFLGRNSRERIIIAGYSSQFVVDNIGVPIRRMVKTEMFQRIFPDFKLDLDKAEFITTEQGGSITFAGRNSSITGRSATLILVDDPYKDYEEAFSDVIREKIHKWFRNSIVSRIRRRTKCITLHTRWHTDDILGRNADPSHPEYAKDPDHRKVADSWNYLNIPAICSIESAEMLNEYLDDGEEPFVEGDSIWPDEHDLETLELKRLADPVEFSALYMGQPSPDTGAFFDVEGLQSIGSASMPYSKERAEEIKIYAGWDVGLTTSRKRDATAFVVGMLDERTGNVYILDALHIRLRPEDMIEKVLDMCERWNPIAIWHEKGQIDHAIGGTLRDAMKRRKVWFNFQAQSLKGDKEIRAQGIRTLIAQKRMWFPKDKTFWAGARAELLQFPAGLHDDFVDALSWFGKSIGHMISSDASNPHVEEKPIESGTMAWFKASIEREDANKAITMKRVRR
jgi:predicted phage terminase large subunit-like protein